MSLLRPGAVAALMRWRGPLAALALAGGGLWLFGAAALAGAPLALAALALTLAVAGWIARDAILHARLSAARTGPGVVAVREGAVAYFGPHGGGVADLDALTSVALAPGPDGQVWLLRGADGAVLRAPAAAQGADALLDAFAALPGFDRNRVLRAARAPVETVVWRRGGPAAPVTRLAP